MLWVKDIASYRVPSLYAGRRGIAQFDVSVPGSSEQVLLQPDHGADPGGQPSPRELRERQDRQV
jgi:hypothetical protein